MAETDKIITIEEAQDLVSGCFPDASGTELKRCPTMSELSVYGFISTSTTRTYDNNQCVVKNDLSGGEIRYVIESPQVVYYECTSGFDKIFASGSNYAQINANVKKYTGSHYDGSTAMTLTPLKVGGDSAFYVENGTTKIRANNRDITTGAERTATFCGTYGGETSSTVTVTQEENRSTTSSLTQSFSISSPQLISSDGDTTRLIGTRRWHYWYKYTSNSVLPRATDNPNYYSSTGGASATTYTIPSSARSWITTRQSITDGIPDIIFSANTGNNERTAVITAGCKTDNDVVAATCTTTIKQYRAPYDTYEYQISSCGINPQYISSGDSGTNHTIEITATCRYRKTHWKDGAETQGTWSAYTDTNQCNVTFSGSIGHFGFYNGSQTSTSQMNLTFNSNNVGRVYVYATSTNQNQGDITQSVIVRANTATTSVTVTHKGYGNISITIDPVSGTFADTGESRTFTVDSNVTGWQVSASDNWIRTSVDYNTNTVSVTANSHTSTSSRTGTVSVTWGGTTYATYTVMQSAYVPPEIPGVEKLFDLTDGWLVGRYQTSQNTTPCTYSTYIFVIARSDRGVDTDFLFDIDEAHVSQPLTMTHGYYTTNMCGNYSKIPWFNASSDVVKPYTGQTFTATNYQGQRINCYGFSIGGGPQAEVLSTYAGISII